MGALGWARQGRAGLNRTAPQEDIAPDGPQVTHAVPTEGVAVRRPWRSPPPNGLSRTATFNADQAYGLPTKKEWTATCVPPIDAEAEIWHVGNSDAQRSRGLRWLADGPNVSIRLVCVP